MDKPIESSFDENSRFVYLVTQPIFLVVFSVISLIVIILYGVFVHLYYPYYGMEISWDTNFGRVSTLFPEGPADRAGVLEGDRLLSIDGKQIVQWSNGPAFRSGIRAGDTVVFELQRGQETLRIPIIIGGYFENWNWVWDIFLIHFLAISFWTMGAAMCLFSPTNDIRSRLLGLGFLLAGMTAAVGLAGGWNSFWGANALGIILRNWLGPVYVAAHLTFPSISFPKYRRLIINFFVIVAIILTILVLIVIWISNPGELTVTALFGLDIRRVALIFFFFSWVVGTGLLLYNRIYSKDPDVKRQTGVVLWGSVLGFSPFFVFIVLPFILFQEQFTGNLISLVFLLLVPLSYIYVIYQRKLLRMDFIINRFVVLFVMVLFVFITSVLILGFIVLFLDLPPSLPFIGGIVVALIALPLSGLQRNIQVRVNRVLYGNHYDFSTVTTNFSSQLAITSDRNTLFELLTRDLSTQMRIQNSALYLADGKNLVLQPTDVKTDSIPLEDAVCQFLLDARNPVRGKQLWSSISEVDWRRWQKYISGELFVPMVFEGKLQGVLILGERITTDLYSESDIQIIAAIAYQGALAYANVQLVETLRGLAQRLVRTDEDQRRKVARELHDTVLQDLFFVRQKLPSDATELTGHINNIVDQLRQTIKAQRTALLDQGLELALESLVEDMQSLSREDTQILWNNTADGKLKLTDEQATSIYRIAQEAITNAIKHAKADNIYVKLEGSPGELLEVIVKDDGIGMQNPEGEIVSENHYGLIGMQERALMIGANLIIKSEVGEGTMVKLEMGL
jgi:signal transduction histidine kinase